MTEPTCYYGDKEVFPPEPDILCPECNIPMAKEKVVEPGFITKRVTHYLECPECGEQHGNTTHTKECL